MDMKQAAKKIPAANRLPGRMDIARFTVASTAPLSLIHILIIKTGVDMLGMIITMALKKNWLTKL